MRNQSRWAGIAGGVVMGVLFSAALGLAGSLEPSEGVIADSLEKSSIQLPIVLKTGGTPISGVPRTGQKISYGPGDDGALQKGVPWPSPRFSDNANGTVTDNLTGLIWLKNANVFGGKKNWVTALTDCNSLAASGTLTDGSAAGDWRLPNRRELFSLIDDSNFDLVLPTGHPFVNVKGDYWSSTTLVPTAVMGFAWVVNMSNGYVFTQGKETELYVWPVRGGQ
jgi:hypothetical protein